MTHIIDLPLEHEWNTDCPVPPDTQVRVQYAGLNFDATGRLGVPSQGRADRFCWNAAKFPWVDAVVAYYEVLPAAA